MPDPNAFIKLLTHEEAPTFLGGWALVTIIAASMSTCDGAILAMGTVFSHNIIRNFSSFFPSCFKEDLINTNKRLRDFTGLDSLISPVVAVIVFVLVQFLERNGPVVEFAKDGLMAPYLKEGQVSDDMKTDKFEDENL